MPRRRRRPDEQSATTVTLEVNPKQADTLAWADSNANLRLALRSPREPVRSEPTEELVIAGNSGGAPNSAPAPVPPVSQPMAGPPVPVAAPAMAAPQTLPNPVQLIDGDQIVNQGGK